MARRSHIYVRSALNSCTTCSQGLGGLVALWGSPHLWHTSHCVCILHLTTVPVTLCKGAGGDNAPHSTHSQEDTHYNTSTQYTTKRNAHFRHATVSMRLQYTAASVHTPVKLSCIQKYCHTTYIRMYTWTTRTPHTCKL